MMSRAQLIVLALFTAASLTAACGGQQPEPPAPETAAVDTPTVNQDSINAEEERRRMEEAERLRRQREADSLAALARGAEEMRAALATMVHFDYDKADIRADDAAILDAKIAILQSNPNVRIRVHGHCDERGSDEYNLALGNRRAAAVKQYLVNHGIDASRIETQSWGEERPLAQGASEDAWSQNRRAEFEIVSGG
jgi:peptidoglycan-associated lipoprotein